MLQSILTIVFFLPIVIASKEHWSYENITSWPVHYHYCDGKRQSPIDLQFDRSIYNRHLKRIYFQRKQSSLDPPQLTKNDHTVQLHFKNHYILKDVTYFNEDYKVAQLHFHWGDFNNNITGSEHLLENRSYPLEMHIVAYSSRFSNISAAMPNTRALAVIGAFFELTDEPNEYLQPIVDALEKIQHKGDHQPVNDTFKLIPLTGEEGLSRYYRYDGSLTTPPCYESVIWSVLTEPLKLSYNQLNAFRNLSDEKNGFMKNTYRVVQEIGTRKIFRSFRSRNIVDGSKEYISTAGNRVQYLPIYMKIFVVLISFLMMII